ncbi:MAG: transporter [Porticoccaceae bacterium]
MARHSDALAATLRIQRHDSQSAVALADTYRLAATVAGRSQSDGSMLRAHSRPEIPRSGSIAMDDTLGSYGADQFGLICGYRFVAGMAAVPIATQAALGYLDQPPLSDGDTAADFIWLHFNLANSITEKWLKQHLTLTDAFFDALHEDLRSTRIDHMDGALLAIINDVLYDFSFGPSETSTLWVHVGPALVVTARRYPLRSIDQLRTAVKNGETIRSPVELLNHLLHDQADVLVNIVRRTTERVDLIEDRLLAGRLDTTRLDLSALRRLLVRLQRLLAPEPAAFFRLLQRPPTWVADADVQELSQSSEEFSVVLRDMAVLQERIKLLQEEIAAQVMEENNRTLSVLTFVTVLALPINMTAGLFGMNVGGIPLAQSDHGFWLVAAIVVGVTAVAGWLAFRRQRR